MPEKTSPDDDVRVSPRLMPKFKRVTVDGRTVSQVWKPTRVRQRHLCCECRREIGRGSIAYRTPYGGTASHRICAACAMEMLNTGRAVESD